jgi:hypothetical protein
VKTNHVALILTVTAAHLVFLAMWFLKPNSLILAVTISLLLYFVAACLCSKSKVTTAARTPELPL